MARTALVSTIAFGAIFALGCFGPGIYDSGGGTGPSGGGSGPAITDHDWGCDPNASSVDDLFWFYAVATTNTTQVWADISGRASANVTLSYYPEDGDWYAQEWADDLGGFDEFDCDYESQFTVTFRAQ